MSKRSVTRLHHLCHQPVPAVAIGTVSLSFRHTIVLMAHDGGIEDVARRRLRCLIGASTISRIETGHRRLAVDNLAELARALDTTVDQILAADDNGDDVVIRPSRNTSNGSVNWPLTRLHDPSGRVVMKMRIPASTKAPDQRVHPGRDWFYVLEGTVRLVLGDREILVEAGQAAEFDTMTPHWFTGFGGPVEILTIFDRHGEEAHLRARAGADVDRPIVDQVVK